MQCHRVVNPTEYIVMALVDNINGLAEMEQLTVWSFSAQEEWNSFNGNFAATENSFMIHSSTSLIACIATRNRKCFHLKNSPHIQKLTTEIVLSALRYVEYTDLTFSTIFSPLWWNFPLNARKNQ